MSSEKLYATFEIFKIKRQLSSFNLSILKGLCDICFSVYKQKSKYESLDIYHNDFNYHTFVSLRCCRSYFELYPEKLRNKFEATWFTATEIKNISRTKTVVHPCPRSNQDIKVYDGKKLLKLALHVHGGYVGPVKASKKKL